MQPNFIIVGGKKCGTTSIASILRGHPDVFVPELKEVHFFDYESKVARGIPYYETFFADATNEKVIMDVSPNYMYVGNVPERIKTLTPDVKLIFFLRNPVNRAYSHYWDHVRRQAEPLDFENALERKNSYIEKSLYHKHLIRFFSVFDKNDILLLKSEEFFDSPQSCLEKLAAFLEISPRAFKEIRMKENYSRLPRSASLEKFFLSSGPVIRTIRKLTPAGIKKSIKTLDEKLNMKKFKPSPMSAGTKEMLMKKFASDINELEKLSSLDLRQWKE